MKSFVILPVLFGLSLAACAQAPQLPAPFQNEVAPLSPDDPDYSRAALSAAIKPAGAGGVFEGTAVRLTQDLPVYRLWSGPASADPSGRTNRLGSWWSPGSPHGSAAQYRVDYEICQSWNSLTWAARCTLKKGAVVVIGPGQSVSAETCKDPSGQEHYPADSAHWQIYLDHYWTRTQEFVCEPESDDYPVDPQDVAQRK